MTMDTAYDKTVSMVGWNVTILPTNCFLIMYDIPEYYAFFLLCICVLSLRYLVFLLLSISPDVKTSPTLQLTPIKRNRIYMNAYSFIVTVTVLL